MKRGVKDFIVKFFFCLFVLAIPLVLCLYAVQARRYTALTSEIKELDELADRMNTTRSGIIRKGILLLKEWLNQKQ